MCALLKGLSNVRCEVDGCVLTCLCTEWGVHLFLSTKTLNFPKPISF